MWQQTLCNKILSIRFLRNKNLVWSEVLILFFFSCLLHSQEFITPGISTAPNPVGSGARAMGQGNAFIAIADDATAASWNPAGLSQLVDPEISFAFESLYRREKNFSSLRPEAEKTNSLGLQDLNYLSLVFNRPYKEARNMTFSLSYFKQFRFDKEIDFSIRFRTELSEFTLDFDHEQEGALSVWAPAIAFDITPHLALGATLNIWNDSLTQDSVFGKRELSAGTLDLLDDDDPAEAFGSFEENRFIVDEGYSLVLGAMVRFNREFGFGLVYKPKYRLDIDHRRRITDTIENTVTSEMKDAKLRFPDIIGAGFFYHPKDSLTYSTDVTWTDWSKYEFKEDGRTTNPLTGRDIEREKLTDTITVRVGAEYLHIKENFLFPFRCGFGYDPAPANKSVDDTYTVSVGGGIQWRMIMFDLAYQYRWGNRVNQAFLEGINGSQNIDQHRVLASLIVYFDKDSWEN